MTKKVGRLFDARRIEWACSGQAMPNVAKTHGTVHLRKCVEARSPFDLRQQVGKLVVTKLAIFPTDLEAEAVLGNDFTLHSIRDPDNRLMEQESLGFLSVHIG